MDLSPIGHEFILDDHALWEKEGKSWAIIGKHKELEFLAKATMVVGFPFLQDLKMFLQGLFGWIASRIDPR